MISSHTRDSEGNANSWRRRKVSTLEDGSHKPLFESFNRRTLSLLARQLYYNRLDKTKTSQSSQSIAVHYKQRKKKKRHLFSHNTEHNKYARPRAMSVLSLSSSAYLLRSSKIL